MTGLVAYVLAKNYAKKLKMNIVSRAYYNDSTQELELTFQNGDSATIPVSDLTKDLVNKTDFLAQVRELEDLIDTKQNKLTAGENITIENDVISANVNKTVCVGRVKQGGVFPVKRADGTPLEDNDYVVVDPTATLPFEIDGILFEYYTDMAFYTKGLGWVKGTMDTNKFPDGTITNIEVGGMPSGTDVSGQNAIDALTTILIKDLAPTVVINNPTVAQESLEEGYVLESPITISATITKADTNVKSVDFYVAGEKVHTEDVDIDGTDQVSFDYEENISTNTLIKVQANDATNTGEGIRNIKFYYNAYWGLVPANITTSNITEEIIEGLTNHALSKSQGLTYSNINLNNQKIVYAYPANYAALKQILDQNGFGYLESYDTTTINITNQYNKTTTYRVYLLRNAITQTDFKQIYS